MGEREREREVCKEQLPHPKPIDLMGRIDLRLKGASHFPGLALPPVAMTFPTGPST